MVYPDEKEAPYTCQYCGQPSWLEPIDQTPPPDYCHESDHGSPEEDYKGEKTMTYQLIKRGMTEAVTRGELEAAKREGREPVADVTQLTWFNTKEGEPCVCGVFDGIVYSWYEDGKYYSNSESQEDLFALPRYEWQWLTISPSGRYNGVTDYYQTVEEAVALIPAGWKVERIEGSKRLVKE